jgi:hypothetical protein
VLPDNTSSRGRGEPRARKDEFHDARAFPA